MANPFYVEPANVFQTLMTGVQGFEQGRKMSVLDQRRSALAGANGDFSAVAKQLAANGDIEGANMVATVAKNLAGPELTPDIKNFQYSQLNPAFGQYQVGLKRAGAISNTVNLPPQEKAYDQTIGKELAELNVGIIKGASSARSNLANIDRLDQLLSDPAVYQGTGGESVLQAKKLAKSLGIDVGDVGGAEAARAISNQLALNARNPAGGAGMPGAMSDADRDYLKAMQPGIDNTPGGNKLIIDVNRKLNQRAIDVEKFRQDYVRKNGRLNEGFYRELNDWSNANPLFAGAPRAGQGAAQPVAGGQQRGGQPPIQGARQGADGNFYVPDPQRPGKYLRVVQ